MKYHFLIHYDEDGMWAEGMELSNCNTMGDTYEELLHNIAEALNGILDEPPGSNIIFPYPIPDLSGENIVEVPVEPNIAFAQLLRQARIQARKTQREVQEAMGLPNKTSYTRLERRGNPTLMTISKVLEVFPDFPLMEALGK